MMELSGNRFQLLSNFLQKYSGQLSNVTKAAKTNQIKVNIVTDEQQYLDQLGQTIRNGELVAFPTQTVYGLGADATNQQALLKIYKTKKRPLTDPIIAHVLGYEEALPLTTFRTEFQQFLFKQLTKKFWPGPLTIILRANLEVLPMTITAQTGFVGVRAPKHPFARKLLSAAKRPIGAPSANLFSHVSPTSSVHVFNDFFDQPITIVDGERCEFGIQSTVIKLEENRIEVLREGSLFTQNLKQFINTISQQKSQKIQVIVTKKVQDKQSKQGMQAPGQLLKHYAPYLPCFSTTLQALKQSKHQKLKIDQQGNEANFKETVLIVLDDAKLEQQQILQKFHHLLSKKQQDFNYEQILLDEDKFCSKEDKIKMKNLYFLLRKAQNCQQSKAILVLWDGNKQGTIWDKIFRATQGNQAMIL